MIRTATLVALALSASTGVGATTPAQWIEAWLAKQIDLPEPEINHGTLETRGFGYLWWRLDFDGEAAFAALGHGGQELLVFPARELVVVFTSHWPGPSSTEHYRHLRRLLDDQVLPAFPPAARRTSP